MKERLIELQFEKWLLTLDLAPYPVIFWDTPEFIQHAYIQKWLREIYKINILICPLKSQLYWWTLYKEDEPDSIDDATNTYFETYEKALKPAIQEALKLIKV